MIEDIERVLLSEEQIRDIVSRLGRQISEDYKGRKLLMVSVLKGSVVFMADLMRAITIPCEIDFMSVSSYGSGTESSGEVKIIKDLKADYAGTEVPDEFVVGYGLDYDEKYRNVPFLGVLSRSVYEK